MSPDTFAAEMRKARSYPAIPRTLALGAAAILAAAIFGMVQMTQFLAQGREEVLMGMNTTDWPLLLLHYGQVIPVLLGAWVVGQDLPAGPRRSMFLATARRGTIITIKLIIAGLIALIAGLVCTITALMPLLMSGDGAAETTVSLAPYGWLIGYWVLIGVVTAALVAAARNITFAVVPILIWTVGLSDLLAVLVPALSGALDQVFKSAYLEGGSTPSFALLISAAVQVILAIALGSVLFTQRDTH